MAIDPPSNLRQVTGLAHGEQALIQAFMQGAVYAWIRDRSQQWFAVRDLAGGPNWDWDGTPLYTLFRKHQESGKLNEAAVEAAGKDLGWLVKSLLADDKRHFRTEKRGLVRMYAWVGDEP